MQRFRVVSAEDLTRVAQTVNELTAAGTTLGTGVILLSAGVGLPPFYVVSIACGLLRIPFMQFFVLGLIGRLARFGVIVLAPQLLKLWAA